MKKLLTLAGLFLGLSTCLPVFAQQTGLPPAGQEGGEQQQQMGRRRGREDRGMRRMGRKRERGMRALSRLNLNETQQTQIRAIRDASRQRTQAQRDELRQLFQSRQGGSEFTPEQQARARQLMTELRSTDESIHQEILGVLTTEQRSQLEQWREEQKSRRQGMRKRGMQRENDELQ